MSTQTEKEILSEQLGQLANAAAIVLSHLPKQEGSDATAVALLQAEVKRSAFVLEKLNPETKQETTMQIQIGSIVRFIWKHVHWQGTVMAITQPHHARSTRDLHIAVLGYENMFSIPSELCAPV